MNKQLTIGLFGFGVVGEGIYKVLQETPSLNATIKRICIKHPDKKRNAPDKLFTTHYIELLGDDEINLIVELIDDAEEAHTIVTTALRKGKAVVSANKKMIAEHLTGLLELQRVYNSTLLYEAAVCGSIPVIRNLEEYYDNDMLKGICGIVNGSTNFILTKMIDQGISYNQALLEAQAKGFAESDPELDVSGRDAANKLVILLLHAYGINTNPAKLLYRGIKSIHAADATMAADKDCKIKLIARAYKLSNDKIAAYVLPQFIKSDSQLYNVSNEFNGVVIESKLADKQFLYGKGAGRYPTSSAVLSDIAALRYNYQYEYRKLAGGGSFQLDNDFFLRLYVSFNDFAEINKSDFEKFEELSDSNNRSYCIAVIHFQKLIESNWFNNPNISIILMPEGIIEKQVVEYSANNFKLDTIGS